MSKNIINKIKLFLGLIKDDKCNCGRYSECINKIHVTKLGDFYRTTKGMLGCGEMQEMIKDSAKIMRKHIKSEKNKK